MHILVLFPRKVPETVPFRFPQRRDNAIVDGVENRHFPSCARFFSVPFS